MASNCRGIATLSVFNKVHLINTSFFVQFYMLNSIITTFQKLALVSCLRNVMNHICHTRNSRFNLPPGRLDVESNFAIHKSRKCFNVAALFAF